MGSKPRLSSQHVFTSQKLYHLDWMLNGISTSKVAWFCHCNILVEILEKAEVNVNYVSCYVTLFLYITHYH